MKSCELLCNKLDLENGLYNIVVISAFFHDIGKLCIPNEILLKQTNLNDNEFSFIKLHSLLGYNLLKDINNFKNIAEGVLYHHERWDGNGYLCLKKCTDIPIQSRIISIVDVYDALIHERPYKKSFDKNEALNYIYINRGIQFDPIIADTFIKTML